MIDINAWMDIYSQAVQNVFPGRVFFIGLQGSYGRGEATDTSDIDTVLILDELTPADIKIYSAVLDTLPYRELTCGFLSGKQELLNWEPADLFQFYYDTEPILGSLDSLLQRLDADAVSKAIKIGACNVYHGCVHNMLHRKRDGTLKGLYKAASFTIQAICFRQTGVYYRSQTELRKAVAHEDRQIVDTFLNLKAGGEVRFAEMSEALFLWAKKWVNADSNFR